MFVFGKHVENTSYSHMGMDQYLYIPFLGEWTSIYQLFWCSPGVQGFDTLPYIPMVKLLSHEIIGEFRSDGILLCSPAGSPCSVVKRARPIDYPWLSYWHVKHRHVNLLTCETLSELINFRIYFRQVKYKKTAAWNSQNTSHGMMSSHGFRYKQFVDKAKDDSVPNRLSRFPTCHLYSHGLSHVYVEKQTTTDIEKANSMEFLGPTVDGCEILHQKDGWNRLKPYK